MFDVGEKIFYPVHGAGTIEAIEEKEVLGEKKFYYILKIPHINVQIMIPTDKAEKLGMRQVVDLDTLQNVLEIFNQGSTDPSIYENQRFCAETNKKRIKSGDIYKGSEVIRDLMRKSKKGKLGTEDDNMLNNARRIFISEIVQVKGLEEEEAATLLEEIFEEEQAVEEESVSNL